MADMLGGDIQFLGQGFLRELMGPAQFRDARANLLVVPFFQSDHPRPYNISIAEKEGLLNVEQGLVMHDNSI